MRNLLAIALCLPLVACVVGDGTEVGDDQGGGGGGGGDGSGDGTGGGSGSGISGKISADTTWTGAVAIGGNVQIDPGVTVTIEAGSTVAVKAGAVITINGILDAKGTSAGKITISGEGTQGFGGIAVNGQLKYSYVTQTAGGITTFTGGTATIIDSHFSRTSGDFLMMNGGTVDMQYSAIGLEPGQTDTTHCNMHFGGAGNVIKVTHSNVSTAPYGIMFYGGMAADFTYNNWFGNGIDVDVQAASPVSGTFSNGWFEKGAPVGGGITAQNLAGARLAACNGTNNDVCAGPRP
jgi:hypothetical protein